ncbi:uncharacterized protein KY384_004118 [Bacidia gigantensis]|uniref:uncharacterized protein n=1 Tax=Bacidia gigantensis TaxID=2732470 RepID=UPI001D03F531|nr:uncharacterized protein KY384_004118 [Bacidia gigantensis]KAG8530761.1 hypothetical protein KY384_004118 [Bacidia gigantensis]
MMIIRHHPKTSHPALSLTFLLFLILQTLLHASIASATDDKKDAPTITSHKFEVQPAEAPFYFTDSDVILILTMGGTVLRSADAGASFAPAPGIPENSAYELYLHPYEDSTAYVWAQHGSEHYVTSDRGETWRSFEIRGAPRRSGRPPFSFHAGDSNKVIINICTSIFLCDEVALYTLDGFETEARSLREQTRGCTWARSTPEWGSNFIADPEDDQDKGTDNDDRIVCVVQGRFISFPFSSRDNRLVVSDDFFENEEEPILQAGRTVQGIVNMAPVKGFLVAAASAKKTDELALYVTDDAKQWHRAIFPKDHRLEEDAYTILESTNYSIQVDVMTTPSPLNAMGVMFTSNSNGTYFTQNIEHTNRNFKGSVDFEKVAGIQGVVLVNVVDNWEDIVDSPLSEKKVKSKISFDDGRTFEKITADGDDIHLHSVTDISNMGRVFSSPAPGIVMGIGNTGKFLKQYEDGDLYVSDNAGLTWSRGLKNAHKYEFGDRGAVLVAIYDEGPTNEIQYSIDHGRSWKKTDLDVSEKVTAKVLTTTPDSTSLKFFLLAAVGEGPDSEYYSFSIDFSDYHKGGKCGEGDFELWDARVDDKGKPICIMGSQQLYRRRKPDAECFVDKEFEDPQPEFKPCACTEEDFECDYNFLRSEDGTKCVPSTALTAPDDQCKDGDKTFKGSSGFRLIPGNRCDPKGKDAVDMEKEEERDCGETIRPPASGDIISKIHTFESSGGIAEYHYLERTDASNDDDETVVALTTDGDVWITRDAGKSWKQIFKEDKIAVIYPHTYRNDVAFFLTEGKKVHYTYNRGANFGQFKAPEVPTRDQAKLPVLSFHPRYKDWLIWTGQKDCEGKGGQCHNVAYFSKDRGGAWDHQLRYVKKCQFIDSEGREHDEDLIYCEQFKEERLDQPKQLKWSNNWFADDHQIFGDIIDFATMSEFIVVAARKEDNRDALSCHTSVDGKTFAHAQFPPSFDVPTEKAYTVLESKTHAVFLHVTVNNIEGSEYGAIIKSNSNGTSYVMSLEGVNRNTFGYVDFDKLDILEGVMVANTVTNMADADAGKPKTLQTVITHNDGAQWAPIKAPEADVDGKSFDCDVSNTPKCSLHLHSYTERQDRRALLSSASAIGLVIGVGNVGDELISKADGDTFLSRDGGISWQNIKKGTYKWAYGDQGSIIVIVEDERPTKIVYYSLDEGNTWIEYQFADKEYSIARLSTVPSDTSRNFILWSGSEGKGEATSINLDFTGLTDRLCELDENNPDEGDYDLWEPRHPLQEDNCLFGHVAQYHRKKIGSNCYNGPEIEKLHSIGKNCSCTREDFECDYNFQIQTDGSCQLVAGLSPPDHSQQCIDNPDLISYFAPTGYRRTPLDTCSGGRELEYTSRESSCPDHQDDFEKEQRAKGLSGFWFFVLVFILPIAIASGVGYWVYNNWDGKFGRIRLGEPGSGPGGSSGAVFDSERPWIKYPIVAAAAVVAVISALPLVLDEDELLGDDEEEDGGGV